MRFLSVLQRRWIVITLAIAVAAVIGCGSSAAVSEEVATSEPADRPGSSVPTATSTPQATFEPSSPISPGNTSKDETPVQAPTNAPPTTATGTPEPAPPTATAAATSIEANADFALLSTNGGVVSFGELRGTVPLVLFFYGGSACTGCEERLSEMQDSYSRFRQAGAELLAISTDQPGDTRMTVDRLGIEFPVLSDVDTSVSTKWDLFNLLGNGHAAPALFIFNPAGDEIASQIGRSADDLPSVEEMLQTIQQSLNTGTAEPTATPKPVEPPVEPEPRTPGQAVSLGIGVTDFRLPDAIGEGEVALGETLRDRNVILVFYRAFW